MGCSASSSGGTLVSAATVDNGSDLSFRLCFELGAKLGQGSYGAVHICKNVITKQEDAVKVVSVHSSCYHTKMKGHAAVSQERDVWRHLGKHTNVVELLQTIWNPDSCYFVMEKCEYALLSMLSMRVENIAEDNLVCNIFPQMVQGLEYCHSKWVIHRDVKPMNFLATHDGIVKIADFGSAILLRERVQLRGAVGTVCYMSPEMLAGFRYDFGTDIWSFAATVYRLLYGEYPHQLSFKSSDPNRKQKQKNAIIRNDPKPRFRSVKYLPARSEATTEFIRFLLERDKSKRLDAKQCLAELTRLGDIISDLSSSLPVNEVSAIMQSSTNVKPGQIMVKNVLHYDFSPSNDTALDEQLLTISPPSQDVCYKMDENFSGDTSTYFESYGRDGIPVKDKLFEYTTTLSSNFESPVSSYGCTKASPVFSGSLPSTRP